MRTVQHVLAQAKRAGLTLEPRGDGKIIARPAERLTPELRDEIVRHRSEILQALHRHQRHHGHHHDDQVAELRRLVATIARCAPAYWHQSDIDEAVEVGSKDMDSALQTFGAILAEYRRAGLRP